MPVLRMQEPSWDEPRIMLANGTEQDLMTSGGRQGGSSTMAPRSQDDARVSYFPRPQADVSQQYSMHQALTVSEIEREFHRMSFENLGEKESRNLWENDKGGGGGGDCSKGIFVPNHPWMTQEDSWAPPNVGDGLNLNELITATRRRPGSFPGASELPPVMSPRSVETTSLGINMAEYVLGTSPLGKDHDNRLTGIHRFEGYTNGLHHGKVGTEDFGSTAQVSSESTLRRDVGQVSSMLYPRQARQARVGGGDADNGKLPVDKNALMFDVDAKQEQEQGGIHMNGTLQNGLDEKAFSRAPGSRQNSPTSIDSTSHSSQLKHQSSMSDGLLLQSCQPASLPMSAMQMNNLSLDVASYEVMGYDPFQTSYGSQLLAPPHVPPPPLDSPNFNIDYNHQQMMQARQQQGQIAMMPPQQPQYALSSDQLLGMATYSSPCVMNSQDAFGAGMSVTGPAMMPQYYGLTPSWPVYPNGTMMPQQQQQQQQTSMATGTPQPPLIRNQNTRPATPQQQSIHDAASMQSTGGAAGYQLVAAPAYYDQSGQLLMSGGRGIGQLVRLVSPAPVLMNAGPGQQGYTPSGNMYTPGSGGVFNPRNNTPSVWLNPQQPTYTGGPVGSNTIGQGVIGSGGLQQQQQQLSLLQQQQHHQLHQQRRDSLGSQDFKQQHQQMPMAANFSQFYSANMSPGNMGLMPAGTNTLTPPPSMSNSLPPLPGLGLGSGGRLYSAAPGAEAKFRSSSTGASNSNALFGASLFNVQQFAKSDGMSKEAAGRSQLLEDFRGNRIPNLQLKDLTNHVVEFSQDQHGSRFIQQKLEHATSVEKSMIFGEILTSAYGLMTDVFGNYVIQKFFEFGSQDQKQTLAQRVRGHVLALALHMYGCRVIQKALESITAELQVEIVKELDGHVLKCVKDQNGNHVVQKCIESIDPKHLGFITDAFKGQVLNLAMHPYGCRVIQRILEHCAPDQVKPIMDELLQHTEHLVHDQYGNYVIQHVLEQGVADDKSRIIGKLRGKMMVLSQHKFASNVVEKCVSHSSRAERANIIEEVCTMNDGPQSALYTMMKDQFANYVVQKMIDLADPPQRKLLLQKIRPHIAILRRYAYGKHILAKLEKFYMKSNAELGPIGAVPASTMQ